MIVTIIVAIDKNNGIGYKGDLLCHLPDDLKHFKQLTLSHTVIMGRKTFDSLPGGALKNRRNIVISSQKGLECANATVVGSLLDALALCESEEEVFIIGGGSIYQAAMANADKLEITRLDARFDADVYFPTIDEQIWQLQKSEKHEADDRHICSFSFETYVRK